jgi:hypothetical protein
LQVRILQGYVDGETGIKLSKTPIMTLGKPEEEAANLGSVFMTLVKWILAKPVGNTK